MKTMRVPVSISLPIEIALKLNEEDNKSKIVSMLLKQYYEGDQETSRNIHEQIIDAEAKKAAKKRVFKKQGNEEFDQLKESLVTLRRGEFLGELAIGSKSKTKPLERG